MSTAPWDAPLMGDYRRIELMRAEIARLRDASEADRKAMQQAVEALRSFMDAIRFAQDKAALMAAIRAADDQAQAAVASLRERVGG